MGENELPNIYLVQPNYKGGSGENSAYWIPYSVGSLWAYARLDERIRNNYTLKGLLFLRDAVDKVVAALEHPNIVGFSNYIWNINYNLALAQAIKEKWPETIIVFGGPEVPDVIGSFLIENPFVDIAVHQEAEYTFRQILLDNLVGALDPATLPGVSYFDSTSGVVTNPSEGRIHDLEELPSPYLSGVFDEIMNGHDTKWAATYETNRGCPFKCHFCDWGSLTFSKIKKFPMDRVKKELEWFGDHNIEYIFLADANFGVFKPRDFEIADHLVQVSTKSGFPKNVNIQWAKNSNRDIVALAKQMGSINKGMTLSVQSMSEEVLVAIERRNMAIHNLEEILEDCNKAGIPSYTELILGLPLETYESWQESWHKLLDLGQHCSIEVWIAQTLVNSELNNADERSKYGIKTIKAKDYFFGISDSADPVETQIPETILLIQETNTLPFDDLIEAYMYGWMMVNFHLFGWTQLCARFLKEYQGLAFGDFYRRLFDFIRDKNNSIFLFNQYQNTKKRIIKYLTEGEIKVNLKDEIGLDLKFVGHNLMHATQSVLRYRSEQTFESLRPFFETVTEELLPDLQQDLIRSQEACVIVHGVEYPQNIDFGWNVYDYVFQSKDLDRVKSSYEIDYVSELLQFTPNIRNQSMTEFLNMFWMKRRWGPGTAETKRLNS